MFKPFTEEERKTIQEKVAQPLIGKELGEVEAPSYGAYGNPLEYRQEQMRREEERRRRLAGLPDVPDTDNIDMANPWREQVELWRLGPSGAGDYTANPRGPGGEDLPPGAEGWDYYGRPYYGEGIPGWLNKMKSQLTAPMVDTGKEWLAKQKAQAPTLYGVELPGQEPVERVDVAKTLENVRAGEAGQPLAYVSRALSAILGGVLDIFSAPAQATERGISAVKEVAGEEKAQSQPSRWRQAAGGAPIVPNDPEWERYYREAPLPPPPKQTFLERLEEGWQAGRVLYSGVLEPSTRAEFIRRYRAGEDPYLLAQELENPLVEAVGQTVLDPLNVVGGFGRGVAHEKRIAGALDEFLNVAPEVERLLAAAPSGEAQVAETVARAAAAHMEQVQKIARRVDDLSQKRGLLALTAEGARFEVGRKSGEIMRNIAATAGSPDEAVETVKVLLKLTSDNADEVATGLASLPSIPNARVLLSNAGSEMGLVLRRALAGATGALDPDAFLDALKAARDEGGVEGLVRFADETMARATKELFPTVTERLALAKKVAGGKTLKPWQVPLAKVTPGMEYLARFDKLMRSKIYRPINTFFASVYMGLSPGYAARNAIQNYAQAFVDYGPRAVFRRPSKALENIKAWSGGVVPGGATGFGSVAALDAGRTRLPATVAAEAVEKNAAITIIDFEFERTMRKMLKPGRALPDITPLVEAGMSRPAAQALAKMVLDARGDVKAAVAAARQAAKTGELDVLAAMGWLDEADDAALRAFGQYDDVAQVIRDGRAAGKSADELAGDVARIRDELLAAADDVANEAPVVSREALGADDVVLSAEDLPRNAQTINVNRYQANHATLNLAGEAAENAIRAARQRAAQAADPDLAARLQGAEETYRRLIAAGGEVADEAEAFGNQWGQRMRRIGAAKGRGEPIDIAGVWRDTGLTTPAPETYSEFKRRFWMEFFYPKRQALFTAHRETAVEAAHQIAEAIGDQSPILQRMDEANRQARVLDDLLANYESSVFAVDDAIEAGNVPNAVRAMANQYGIASATEAGVSLDRKILNIINANLPEGAARVDDLAAVDPKVAREALAAHVLKERGETVAEAAAQVPPAPYTGDVPPTPARVISEQAQGIRETFDRLIEGVRENYGRTEPVFDSPNLSAALDAYETAAARGVSEARMIAQQTANAARDFTLLPYGKKRGIDLALGYVYPYQFWYSRTYANWMKRLVQTPEVVAGYARYKDALAKIHAGAPDWWKYNINSNELLGRDDENPLFFNLEATLNPLNGLTGIDFNDRYRIPDPESHPVLNWWTSTLDGLNKFGPSTWTPFNIATAVALSMQGEEDAAARWGGRLIPQTATLKSLLALGHVKIPGTVGNELDPMVNIFSGGLDPYERGRVGRALGAMVEEGAVSRAAALDAARTQAGQWWEAAIERATLARAPGQLSGFLLGVGFKGRSVQDVQIDNFYRDLGAIYDLRPTLSPDEYRRAMDELHAKFPFGEVVLLSRKADSERDAAYAYNVLGRLPPGQKNDLMEVVGISPELASKFYDAKGDMSAWGESDRQKFMGGIVDLGAVIDLPDDATRAEWTTASLAWKEMQAAAKQTWGSDIYELKDAYYALKGDGSDPKAKARADSFMRQHPELGELMDWETAVQMRDPRMAPYYNSIQEVERYYRSGMYAELERQFGEGIYDTQSEYYDLKDADEAAAKAYLKQHPELKTYWDLKRKLESKIPGQIARTAEHLREGLPAQVREDAEAATTGQEAALEALEPAPTYTAEDYEAMLGGPLYRLVEDWIYGGKALTYNSEQKLERVAEEMGISPEMLLAQIEMSLEE